MCGISAILRFAGNSTRDLADLLRMHDAQRHRGPDGEGSFTVDRGFDGERFDRVPSPGEHPDTDYRLIAAVRRLRISDLRPQADQPLVSADRRLAVPCSTARSTISAN